MNEFMTSPGRPSPPPMMMDGVESTNSFETSFSVRAMRLESQVIDMCGTWFAMSGTKNEVLTPSTRVNLS